MTKKASAITRLVLLTLTLLLLVGILIVALAARFLAVTGLPSITHWSAVNGGTVSSSGSVPASQIQDIKIDWVAGSITIQPGDTNEITFEETGAASGEVMVWKQSGKTLHIQFNSVEWWIGIRSNAKKELVITVPRNWSGRELEINNVAANVTLTDGVFREIDLENVSGNYSLQNCKADSLDFSAVSGELDFQGELDKVNCETVSGNCKLDLTTAATSIDFDSMSGDIIVTLPENAGYTVSLDSLSGRIRSDFLNAQGSHTYGDGTCHIDADTLSGDIIIRKR